MQTHSFFDVVEVNLYPARRLDIPPWLETGVCRQLIEIKSKNGAVSKITLYADHPESLKINEKE
jgi:hypothetical protein